jgi:hypothetical protein
MMSVNCLLQVQKQVRKDEELDLKKEKAQRGDVEAAVSVDMYVCLYVCMYACM